MKKRKNITVETRTAIQINFNGTFLASNTEKLKKDFKKAMKKVAIKHGLIKDKTYLGNISAEVMEHQNLYRTREVVREINKVQARDWRGVHHKLTELKHNLINESLVKEDKENVIVEEIAAVHSDHE